MKDLEMLKQEVLIFLENIERVEKFVEEKNSQVYKPFNSNVFGELKHRCVSLKQRLTIIKKMNT